MLPAEGGLVVYTNSWPVGAALQDRGIEVVLLGGRIRPVTMAAVGALTAQALASINVDVAFLGTNGLSFDRGLTTPDADEADVKRQMLAAARQRVFLVDSSKFGSESLARHAALSDVDVLITDDGVTESSATGSAPRASRWRSSPRDRHRHPNPSMDRTLHLTHLTPGEVNRATDTMTEPSGKGVNVALALNGVGVDTCAVLPVGSTTKWIRGWRISACASWACPSRVACAATSRSSRRTDAAPRSTNRGPTQRRGGRRAVRGRAVGRGGG